MSKDNRNTYFAAREATETATVVLSKADMWFNNFDTNGFLDMITDAWCAYYGAYYTQTSTGHKITFTGEQGELAQLPVNHFRNIAQHILVMVTATRPAMECRATNTDYKSLVQAKLGTNLLDYYMREKRLEDYLYRAIEMAIVLGAGYVKLEWNATSGEVYDYNEETNPPTPIYQGDVQFLNLSPFDVVFDINKEDYSQQDWVLCRSPKNRHDLIAKYPEHEDALLKIPSKNEKQSFNLVNPFYDDTDDIFIYEFYHKKTEAMPDGRYILFVDSKTILLDSPMPYRALPVYRVTPSEILGTPLGYSNMFAMMPIQDGINSLYSAIMTNQNAFAVQNVLSPRGADVNYTLLSGGMNVIEYNSAVGKPEAFNPTATPEEVFKFLEKLEQSAETITGVNSVSRGNPEASLKSGNALALVQSMSLQFVSGLQQSYVKLIEDVGTGLLNILKDFASVPRVAAIVGISNRTEMREFNSDDLATYNRVIVDVSNPLSKTTAGKLEMASELLQMGLITSPEKYFQVLNTGKLETMTDTADRQYLLIKAENEELLNGEEVSVIATEQHAQHIEGHVEILTDPRLKNDPELVARVLAHVQEHVNALRNTSPDLLMILKQQPLLPPGAQVPPEMAGPQAGQGEGPQPPTEEEMQTQALTTPSNDPAAAMGIEVPQPATPPPPFENLPTQAQDVTLT